VPDLDRVSRLDNQPVGFDEIAAHDRLQGHRNVVVRVDADDRAMALKCVGVIC
jgi:hypothetical protein